MTATTTIVFLGLPGCLYIIGRIDVKKPLTPLEKKMGKQDDRIQKLRDRYVNEEISVERLEEETEHVLSGQPGRKYIPSPPLKTYVGSGEPPPPRIGGWRKIEPDSANISVE